MLMILRVSQEGESKVIKEIKSLDKAFGNVIKYVHKNYDNIYKGKVYIRSGYVDSEGKSIIFDIICGNQVIDRLILTEKEKRVRWFK